MEVTLRDYIDSRIRNVEDKLEEQAKFNALHFELNEKSIIKAETSMSIRLEGMNQFREQMKDERIRYATKESTELLLQAYDNRLKKLENVNSFSNGKMWTAMALFAAIPTIIALIAFIKG